MSNTTKAFVGADIYDGLTRHKGKALTVDENGQLDVLSPWALPNQCALTTLMGGVITPGFIDLQVNGGGGVMFNADQSVSALENIAHAHAKTGTAAILPTLISDTPERTKAAIDAVDHAIKIGVPGILGIHLEGPHLSITRKGAHDPEVIRHMTDTDLACVLEAADRLPNVMITIAPESVTNTQIKQLTRAGVTVSLGHTDADFDTCMSAFDAGARCVTHLFNAMSQMTGRAPGLVGATLERQDVFCGIIADGIHVHPSMIRLACHAETTNPTVFLVTDAMATVGSDIQSFTLNDRTIERNNGKLTLQDGTLAGADLSMPRALQVMIAQVGEPLDASVSRATHVPRQLLRTPGPWGTLAAGSDTLLYFDANGTCQRLTSAS